MGVIGRYGGEEFAAILPGFDLVEAVDMAERLRRSVEELNIYLDDGTKMKVTVSIGCSACRVRSMSRSSDLLATADAALYVAKRSGRNRTEAASLHKAEWAQDVA